MSPARIATSIRTNGTGFARRAVSWVTSLPRSSRATAPVPPGRTTPVRTTRATLGTVGPFVAAGSSFPNGAMDAHPFREGLFLGGEFVDQRLLLRSHLGRLGKLFEHRNGLLHQPFDPLEIGRAHV